MTERETVLRSVLFLVIGILLLLSLVICVYIVSDERDLIKVEADVTDVTKDVDGTGKNDVTISYEVDGVTYHDNFYYKDDVNVDDKIPIYYHENNVESIKTFKTSKLIFICPAVGLVLCLLGLFELFRKDRSNDEEQEFKTSVINVVDNTQQLKIVTTDTPVKEYVKTPEEKIETEVKTLKKDNVPIIDKNVVQNTSSSTPVSQSTVAKTTPASTPVAPQVKNSSAPSTNVGQTMVSAPVAKSSTPVVNKPELPAVKTEVKPSAPKGEVASSVETSKKLVNELKTEKPLSPMEDAIMKKVQNTTGNNTKLSLDESEIKDVIRDVLKEVLQEVKEDKQPPKKVVQRRVLPNYYYISGTSLIYVEPGKESKEIELKTIKKVVRTINSEGNVVKLVVSNDEIKCILTNMKNIDLEQVANLLHNKMRTIDENFKEEIEHKEY